MNTSLGRIVILVNDYEQAYQFYVNKLGAKVLYDEALPGGERYLHVGFGNSQCAFWLLAAAGEEQLKLVGKQTGGQPLAVLYTDDFDGFYKNLLHQNITINQAPATAPGSKFLHFADLYGNDFVLVQLIP
ncbi:glyoxalase [Chitinophaga caeni]|uniref:Glyoxalase n=1 Tax=Chitinophaga caeni TaxID=2029983 RepID=A0A291QRV5_9BACT|nr:VOC family protein [Chitinophaga caeni]ATL46641.1 glyoxalase [Chitinophaga caeni]